MYQTPLQPYLESMDHSTRRKLLQTGLAAALLAAGGVPAAAGARAGGRLRIGLSGGPGQHRWDPRGSAGLFQTLAGSGLVFDTLTEIAPDGLLRGALATSWTPSQSGQVWTLGLDTATRFHDGRSFDAGDVVASLDLHLAPGASGHGIRDLIASLRALGPSTLEITLKAANPDFPYLLSDPALIIGPAEDAERAFADGIGTGPYRVQSFDGAQRLVVARVAGHPNTQRGNWFDTVEVLALPRAKDRIAALIEGRVDVIDRVPPAQAERLAKDREVQVLTSPATDYIRMSCGAACPTALRETLLDGLRLGIDRPGLAHDLGANAVLDLPMVQASMSPDALDPDAARATLAPFAEHGITLSLDGDLGEDGARVVAALARQLSELGIQLRLAAPDADGALRVVRKTTRPTLDWTLLLALDGSSAVLGHDAVPGYGSRADAEDPVHGAGAGSAIIPLVLDANLVVSNRVGLPRLTTQAWGTGHARMAQRWWRI